MKTRIVPVILTAAITTLTTLFLTGQFQPKLHIGAPQGQGSSLPVNFASFESGRVKGVAPVDFQPAAEAAVKAVVHVKTTRKARTVVAQDPRAQLFGDDFFGDFFGRRQYYIPPQMGSGSGVVISPDGYIVTNNHVIAGADAVTVTFSNRYTTQAKVIGTDPSTDIALLKVEDKNLPFMEFGNSDDVRIGQWVLAVGYPLTLDATVTAGIVSARSRSIGVNRSQAANAIEAFIQTDAAVNPGNSGGPLVNTSGQLIGINSAIASPTGAYAGYSYAIPANIVRKVANDLMEYGSVQRAYLGIEYIDRQHLSPEQLDALGIDRHDAVYVARVMPGGGAEKAGLKKGDFITKVNGVTVTTEPELLEQIARYKPGDHISISYIRDGKEATTTVELKNLEGTTSVVNKNTGSRMLGASFRPLTADEKVKYGTRNGIMVTDPGDGILAARTNIRKGFVITEINERRISSLEELQQALAHRGQLQIAGFYPGQKGRYYYGLSGLHEVEQEQ